MPQAGPWKDRLHSALTELGMQFTADAVEHSQITESNGELLFTTPEEFKLALKRKRYPEGRAESGGAGSAGQGEAYWAGTVDVSRGSPKPGLRRTMFPNERCRIRKCGAFRRPSRTRRSASCEI